MKERLIRYFLAPLFATVLLSGCVVTNQILERQGTKAYLKKDYPVALEKFSTAAESGSDYAQYSLAVMYLEGEGVDKDTDKAVQLLTQAADNGQSDAQLMLGLFYVFGDYVTKDPVKGADLIYKAGVNENDVAMYYMGHLYAAGVGVDKDLTRAQMWMQNAKRFGFPVEDELLTLSGLEALYED